MENIGNKIAQLRKSKGLSQKELAKELNISDKLISKWENSQCSPSVDCINNLCKIFDVDIDTFIDIPNRKKKSSKNIKKKLIITFSSILSCIFLAGFILLTHFVILPAAFKENYLYQIAVAINKTINRGYFNMLLKTHANTSTEYERFSAYYNDTYDYAWKYEKLNKNRDSFDVKQFQIMNGEILLSDNKPEESYDPNKTYNYKYKYPFHEQYKNIQELYTGMLNYYTGDSNNYTGDSNNLIDEIPITNIRKAGNIYYFELDKEYFEDEINNASIEIIGKPTGTIIVNDGYLTEININSRTRYYDDGYHETNITISFMFDIDCAKPNIKLPDYIDDLSWSTYVLDKDSLYIEDFAKTSNSMIDVNVFNETNFNLLPERDLIYYVPDANTFKYKQLSSEKNNWISVELPHPYYKCLTIDNNLNLYYTANYSNFSYYKFNLLTLECERLEGKLWSKANNLNSYSMKLFNNGDGIVIIKEYPYTLYRLSNQTEILGNYLENFTEYGFWTYDDNNIYHYNSNFELIKTFEDYNYNNQLSVIKDGKFCYEYEQIFYNNKIYNFNLEVIDKTYLSKTNSFCLNSYYFEYEYNYCYVYDLTNNKKAPVAFKFNSYSTKVYSTPTVTYITINNKIYRISLKTSKTKKIEPCVQSFTFLYFLCKT